MFSYSLSTALDTQNARADTLGLPKTKNNGGSNGMMYNLGGGSSTMAAGGNATTFERKAQEARQRGIEHGMYHLSALLRAPLPLCCDCWLCVSALDQQLKQHSYMSDIQTRCNLGRV